MVGAYSLAEPINWQWLLCCCDDDGDQYDKMKKKRRGLFFLPLHTEDDEQAKKTRINVKATTKWHCIAPSYERNITH